MGTVKKAYYRSFQAVFNVGARCLYWRRPIPFAGVGSIGKIPELLKKEKVKKVMVVTGPTVGKKTRPQDPGGAGQGRHRLYSLCRGGGKPLREHRQPHPAAVSGERL